MENNIGAKQMQAIAKERVRESAPLTDIPRTPRVGARRDARNWVARARLYVPTSACCTENSNMVHWLWELPTTDWRYYHFLEGVGTLEGSVMLDQSID